MYRKVLFVVAPVVWPNLPLPGVASLSEYLLANNINNDVFDLNIGLYNSSPPEVKKVWMKNSSHFQDVFFAEHKKYVDKILKLIETEKYKFVAFSVYNTNYVFSKNLAEVIKKHFNNIKIIFGGPAVFYFYNYNPDYLVNDKIIDYFIIGEGELALKSVVLNEIEHKQKVIKNYQIKSVSDLPFPTYNKFNLKNYARKNALPIVASRGCINKCNFCAEKLLFTSYRVRHFDDIFREILYHYNKNNIRWFTFYDSIFNANLKNMQGLIDSIVDSKINISWDAQISIRDDMNINLLKKIKQSGCVNLFIGLETGSESILKNMNKSFNLASAVDFFKKLTDAGLNFEVSLILNYPFESEKEFSDTIKFFEKNQIVIKKIAQINPYVYYPGTNVDITMGYNLFKGIQKVEILKHYIKSYKVKYTNSYINNLLK